MDLRLVVVLAICGATFVSTQGFNPFSIIETQLNILYSKLENTVNNAIPLDIENTLISMGKSVPLCTVCKSVSYALIYASRFNINPIPSALVPFCALRYDKSVCQSILDQQSEIIMYIVKRSRNFEDKFCNLLLQGIDDNCGDHMADWDVKIHPRLRNKTKVTRTANVSKSIKVGHITDIHYDSEYSAESPTSCRRSICCRGPRDSWTGTKGTPLGFVGNCDIPIKLVRHAMDHMQAQNPEYVYFTGDIVAHNIWDTSYKSNKNEMKTAFAEFKSHFGNITVLPTLGNHEQHVVNLYAPEGTPRKYSTQWLYDFVSDEWPKLIFPSGNVDKNVQKTIRKGGYYTLKLDSGIRVIVLNNNVCYRFNWWIMLDAQYLMGEQLQWLETVLYEAENNEENVHILMHICPGSECSIIWNKQYHNIIVRYAGTVKAQFCGHSHFEELRLMLDEQDRAAAAVFNGGSLTTYVNLRPNYRMLTINPDTAELDDYTTYYLPIDRGIDSWKKYYSFNEMYGSQDMSLKSLEKTFTKLRTDNTLARKYINAKFRDSEKFVSRSCGYSCVREQISEIILPHPAVRTSSRLYEVCSNFQW